jgi:ribosomal protein S18 acetylase RimI-like enzyme
VTDLVIRPAREQDAPGIAALARNTARFYVAMDPDLFRIPDEDGFVDFLERDRAWRLSPNSLALVAELEVRVVGYLEASLIEPPDSARWQGEADAGRVRLFINFVGTDDGYRQRGIATKLVTTAEDWGRDRGAVVATLDTWIESPLSIPFWERRMGYQRKNVIFRKPLV